MDKTEQKLLDETNKWLSKLKEAVKTMEITDKFDKKSVKENAVDNVHAYIEDCGHFLEQKDYINAFEAIIYAWGIWETCTRMNLVSRKK